MENTMMFVNEESKLAKTDPEFFELFQNFAMHEVLKESHLDDKTRWMSVLAVLIGSQGLVQYEVLLETALRHCISASEIKEIVYQGCAYLGIGRIYPFLEVSNRVFERMHVELPLPSNKTTNQSNRLEKGIEAQVAIFGESMKNFYKSGKNGREQMHKWLAANCFGDYYTRKSLDYAQRELITFCFLYAQGGCEPQLLSHTIANIHIGNDALFLMDVVSQCVPYIGYPRSLNAFAIIEQALEEVKKM